MSYYNSEDKINEQIKLQQDRINQFQNDKPLFIGGQQFFTSMRASGYSNEGEALGDLIDNSIEAGANKIDIVLNRVGGRSPESIVQIALIDDGHGMNPKFLEASIGFGQTSRGSKKDGLGRYGNGMTNAAIAFSERCDIYSKSKDTNWNKTFIDLVEGSPTCFTDDYLSNVLKMSPPAAIEENPPKWISNSIKTDLKNTGTIIILKSFTPEYRKWSYRDFVENLARYIGVTYHKLAGSIEVFIHDEKYRKEPLLVQFIDPLFITPGLRGYDLDEDRAIELPGAKGRLSLANGKDGGEINIRVSVMSPSFALKPEFKIKGKKAQGDNANSRFPVMREYTGVILVRNSRVIGVERLKPIRFGNNQQAIGIELSFSGEADEIFGLTYRKNSVSLSSNVLELLEKIGLHNCIKSANSERDKLWSGWNKVSIGRKDIKGNFIRPSEEIANLVHEESRKQIPDTVQNKLLQEGDLNFKQEIDKKKREGLSEEKATEEITAQILSKQFDVQELNLYGADFIEFKQLGMQTQIIINKDHHFYKELFGSPDLNPFQREAITCLLISLHNSLTLTQIPKGDVSKHLIETTVYKNFIRNWSETFNTQLEKLSETFNSNFSKLENEDDDIEIIKKDD